MTTEPSKPIFIADHMLGSLARWLRMMGYDCRYEKSLDDNEIIGLAQKEKRAILTRDEELAKRGDGFYLKSTSLDDQLAEVSKKFDLRFDLETMRCSVCNGQLSRIDKNDAKGLIPDKSLENASSFWQCDSCKKIYWDGTHWKGILGRFERLGLKRDS